MDVGKSDIKPGEELPAKENVYRIALNTQRDKSNRFIPSTSCFSLSEEDKKSGYGLSVDRQSKTTPEECLARVGCSYKHANKQGIITYKPFDNRDIYEIEVNFLKSLDSIIGVIYDPIYYKPPEKGKPDNPAHSLIVFNPELLEKNEAEIYMKIREHAKTKKVDVDLGKVGEMVTQCRNL